MRADPPVDFAALPDVAAFLEALRDPENHPLPEARALFDRDGEIIVARAPGRLDLMGGIADYSGSLVLQWPLREATLAAAQRDLERRITVVSPGAEGSGRNPVFSMPLSDFEEAGEPVSYEYAREYFNRDPESRWAAYVAGAFLVLMRERGVRFTEGARLLVSSEVPEGKGVSSSAAVEVAAMQALCAAFGISLSPRDLALLCQTVENRVAGAPCGVMDQMASACGEEGALLALLCQPAELKGTVALPAEWAVWGLDSGVRHSVSGADYGSVRAAAFMGFEILRRKAGRDWGGYLANVSPSELMQHFMDDLPEEMEGAEFLARYGGVSDPISQISPDRRYGVRAATAHPVHEHFRVRAFAELLRGDATEAKALLLGELMCQSHASYSACGLGSAGTDRLVELVREAGPGRGLYGAKITGGGSGGTVAVLGRADADEAVAEGARRYAAETGHAPYVFTGSSPGAAAFGTMKISRP